jgi:hypothetical protein
MRALWGPLPDQVDELVRVVTVLATELHELTGPGEHGAPLGCARDMDAAAAAELQRTFIPKEPVAPAEPCWC